MRDSTFWDVTVPRVMSTYAVAIFVLLWVGFAVALVVNKEWLDLLWNWVRGLPTLLEVLVWVVFLPVPVMLWIWESSWTTLVRLLAYGGILLWTYAAVSSLVRAFR